jgi:hypothetical protein
LNAKVRNGETSLVEQPEAKVKLEGEAKAENPSLRNIRFNLLAMTKHVPIDQIDGLRKDLFTARPQPLVATGSGQ